MSEAITFESIDHGGGTLDAGKPQAITLGLRVSDNIVFTIDVAIEIIPAAGGAPVYARQLRHEPIDISWLPRGEYRVIWHCPALNLAPGDYLIQATVWHGELGKMILAHRTVEQVTVVGSPKGDAIAGAWQLESAPGSPPVDELSWRKGHEDWFFRHFDHAAGVIISYMLGNSPLLRGRILDVGCGDGITDLSVFLRCKPEVLVGIDPFEGYKRLPEIIKGQHLPFDELPDGLRYEPHDGNHIPYPDDSFDVVLSWGSVEHIAGGYLQTMREIKRVLRDGGLLFIHPGLYYSNYGHHIGEFTTEPFVHLTRSEDELRNIVLNTEPNYMDRSGEFAAPEKYWQWYKELNPITVSGFEQELRSLEFDFYRAALRTEDRIEYHHPKLQEYSMQDLATVELYLSAINRKSPRPEGYQQQPVKQ